MREKRRINIRIRLWMRNMLLLTGVWLMAVRLTAQPVAPLFPPKKHEVRAVWLTTVKGLDWPTTRATSPATVEKQKRELTDILDRLKQANVNVVLLQTRVRGNLIYPSALEGWCESVSGKAGVSPGYDPLAFAIEECHKRGMELHAWMVTIPLGSEEVHKEMGEHSILKRNRKICKKFRGNWYLNPGHPETKHYLAELVRELVSNYDVDGVHFDYIRYPDRPRRFPDAADFRKYGKGKSLNQWRRDNITELVREAYREVKSLKPWVKVSSAPLGKYRDTQRYPSRGWNAYHAVHQEAQRWMHEGIQDMLFPMLYYRNENFFPFVLDWKEQASGRMVVPGLGIYFLHPSEGDWTLDEVESQLNFVRWSGCEGVAYFRSKFLTDNVGGLYNRVLDHYYYTPALVPPMTWADSIPPAAPEKGELGYEGGEARLSWSASTDNLAGGIYYNVYKSSTFPVDVSNPENLCAVRLTETAYAHPCISPEYGRYFYAVTAMDRCGNESQPLELGQREEEDEAEKPFRVPPVETDTLGVPFRLPVEKGIVTLPACHSGGQVVVCSYEGKEFARLPLCRQLRVTGLPRGCYHVEVHEESGRLYRVGTFVR